VLATSAPGPVSVNANLKRPTLAIIDKVNLTHPRGTVWHHADAVFFAV
jgi:hypothetical protein